MCSLVFFRSGKPIRISHTQSAKRRPLATRRKKLPESLPALRFPFRQEPRRLLVAQSVRCQHREVRLGGLVKVEDSLAFCRDGAKVPARRVHTHDFASGLESARLGGIAFAGGST